MSLRSRRRWWILLLLLTLGTSAAADPDPAGQQFMAAMQRVRLHLPDTPDAPALSNYVIYDYLVAARLRRDLATVDNALDARIDEFLSSRGSQPVTRALRRDWLSSLADRKQWDLFLSRSVDVSDPPLVCDRLAGRLATGDLQGLAEEATARWSMPQKQPDQCSSIFSWLRSKGLLTPVLAEARVRAVLAADNPRLARDFIVDIPPERAAPLLQWVQLLEAPKAVLASVRRRRSRAKRSSPASIG
jgi:soluble lytic murein transglycosylase